MNQMAPATTENLVDGAPFPADPAATLLIDGVWRSTTSTFEVVDPATLEVIGVAADGGADEAREALDAAFRAFASWRSEPAEVRSGYLRQAAMEIRRNSELLARLMTSENGKPLVEARGEILRGAAMLEWSAEEGRRAYGRITPSSASGPGLVLSSPVGPALAITPWNFPASMLMRKIGLSLAAGAPVVVKPAEQTPLIAVAVARLINDVGLPPGVLNVITTARPADVANALLDDTRLRKVSFTGSTEVGLSLIRSTDSRLRRVSLEMGGHSPAIVFPDAEMSITVASIMAAKFANAGQSCIAINRLYVHRDVHEELLSLLVSKVAEMRLGHGATEGITTGPLIDFSSLEKVERHVGDAVERGAKVIVGGHRWTADRAELRGAFYEPTILTGVDDTMQISHEETFGPVLPVYTFDDEDDVIARANNTAYGLAAYVFASDFRRIWTAIEGLDFGVIGVNDPAPNRPELPFGGMKNSGQEREGGVEGIDAYLDTKSVAIRL